MLFARRSSPAPRKPRVNWASRSTRPTIDKQLQILLALARASGGETVRDLASEVGISRQACLYHVKKLVAKDLITAIVEPCDINGQWQFRVWDKAVLAKKHGPRLTMADRIDLFLKLHSAA